MSAFSRRCWPLFYRLTDSCNQLDLQWLVMSESQNCKLLQDRKRWAGNSDSIRHQQAAPEDPGGRASAPGADKKLLLFCFVFLVRFFPLLLKAGSTKSKHKS